VAWRPQTDEEEERGGTTAESGEPAAVAASDEVPNGVVVEVEVKQSCRSSPLTPQEIEAGRERKPEG
jgi:hypothetical protein